MKPVEAYPKNPKKGVMALEQENAEKRRLICNPKNTHTAKIGDKCTKGIFFKARRYLYRLFLSVRLNVCNCVHMSDIAVSPISLSEHLFDICEHNW